MATCISNTNEVGAVAASDGTFHLQGTSAFEISAADMTHYYEVAIVKLPPNSTVAVGLTSRPIDKSYLPGWAEGSIALHSDDGSIFSGSMSKAKVPNVCSPLTEGDVIGVRVFSKSGSTSFYVNGNLVHRCANVFSPPCHIAPAIGLDTAATIVVANFGPKFDTGNARFEGTLAPMDVDATDLDEAVYPAGVRMSMRSSGR